MNNKILVAGPWHGEFGWELFCWQGHIRWLSKKYNKVVVLTRHGNNFLYKDFTNDIYNINAPTTKASMWKGETNQQEVKNILKKIKYDEHLIPFNIGFGITGNGFFTNNKFLNQQTFVKYKSNTLDRNFDIILHPRNKFIGNNRNWTQENFQKLVNLLRDYYTIATIGNDESYKLDNVEKFRNESTENVVSLMNRCKLAVGQSSGPLHLASLCGTPHFVWSHESNRQRYLKFWNPHNTKTYFYSKGAWNPNVNELFNEIRKILQ